MKSIYTSLIVIIMVTLVLCAIATQSYADEHGYTGDGTFDDY